MYGYEVTRFAQSVVPGLRLFAGDKQSKQHPLVKIGDDDHAAVFEEDPAFREALRLFASEILADAQKFDPQLKSIRLAGVGG
jgi:hypothetical protein